jgi:hypothetical protein
MLLGDQLSSPGIPELAQQFADPLHVDRLQQRKQVINALDRPFVPRPALA